ncbi:MAG: hypothetical protein M5R42_01540 [Rhodocyclaceae bacterium]|nr:hypothetical protein [Rhodocyclaceae bacterium]
MLAHVARRYQKPEFGLDHTVIDSEAVAVSEEIVAERPFCRLLSLKRRPSITRRCCGGARCPATCTLLSDTVRTHAA